MTDYLHIKDFVLCSISVTLSIFCYPLKRLFFVQHCNNTVNLCCHISHKVNRQFEKYVESPDKRALLIFIFPTSLCYLLDSLPPAGWINDLWILPAWHAWQWDILSDKAIHLLGLFSREKTVISLPFKWFIGLNSKQRESTAPQIFSKGFTFE